MTRDDRPTPAPAPTEGRRLASLDQFRGYTVVGMLAVNFLGGYGPVPETLKHHNTYCSYADTIMPQFFVAVGFAFRLTFLRRLAGGSPGLAYGHAIRRNLGLILLGLVVYGLDDKGESWAELTALGPWQVIYQAFQRSPFQTLVHIGVTSLWCLPVIAAPALWRAAFLVGSAALHLVLSMAGYFDFAWARPVIDGGPLAFLSWTTPLLVGSFAYDVLADPAARRPILRLALGAVVLMAVGYGISCVGTLDPSVAGGGPRLAAPPFGGPDARPVDVWTMSQRTGSISYLVFAAGFSLAVLALFVAACDRAGLGLGLFDLFGKHALAAYVIHPMVAGLVKSYLPKDAPAWYLYAGFATYFAVTWLFVRHIDRRGARI